MPHPTAKVRRWWGQYLQGLPEGAEPMPEMAALADFLRASIPPSDASRSSLGCITHGDFRLDNLVFRRGASRGAMELAAVLDWELSTLGDPMADLAYCCQPFYLPNGVAVLPSLPRRESLPPGIPSEVNLASQTKLTNPPFPSPSPSICLSHQSNWLRHFCQTPQTIMPVMPPCRRLNSTITTAVSLSLAVLWLVIPSHIPLPSLITRDA